MKRQVFKKDKDVTSSVKVTTSFTRIYSTPQNQNEIKKINLTYLSHTGYEKKSVEKFPNCYRN